MLGNHFTNGLVAAMVFRVFAALAPAAEWEPARTQAVIAGVLNWSDSSLTAFPTKNRKDQELAELLWQRGVPREQVTLLLDEDATRANITKALQTAARRAQPGDTLLFYYAGHGLKFASDIAFANYDIQPSKSATTGLLLEHVGELLTKEFHGDLVILLADCCYSGGLAHVAEKLAAAKIAAVSLTSSEASSTSTQNWTFTQAILDGLHGSALVDANGDGLIALDELVGEVRDAMTFREGQRSGYLARGLTGDLVIGPARGPRVERDHGPLAVGKYVWAMAGNRPQAARIVGRADEKYIVEFYDYSDKRQATLSAGDLKSIEFQTFPVGTKLQVLWQGKSWAAKVLRLQGDFHFIHYENYDHSWDEWVLSNRIVTAADADVEWNGQWYPATIVKRDGTRYFIHFLGYDNSWDEWVTDKRIKLKN